MPPAAFLIMKQPGQTLCKRDSLSICLYVNIIMVPGKEKPFSLQEAVDNDLHRT